MDRERKFLILMLLLEFNNCLKFAFQNTRKLNH